MAKTILLALKRDQKFAESQRHLERVVKPGDRIVFLVEYQLDVPSYLLAHIGLLQTGVDNGVASQERKGKLAWDEQKAWAEKNFAQDARQAFGAIGVEVAVDLYCGSLSRIVRGYLDNDETTLIYRDTAIPLRSIKSFPTSVKNWFVRRRRHYPAVGLTDSRG